MKKPDEIKKALECCFNASQCGDCPYYPVSCDRELVRDAREYIRQLEAERDAAVRVLADIGCCLDCKHAATEPDKAPCNECTNCNGAVVEFKWEWRGVQKEEWQCEKSLIM